MRKTHASGGSIGGGRQAAEKANYSYLGMSAYELCNVRGNHRIAVLGESEVGKSALAERLAQLIQDRDRQIERPRKLQEVSFASGILEEVETPVRVSYANDPSDEGEEMSSEAFGVGEGTDAGSTRLTSSVKDRKDERKTKRRIGERKARPEMYTTANNREHAVRKHAQAIVVPTREAVIQVVDPIEEGRLTRHAALNADIAVILYDPEEEDAVATTVQWIHTARGLGAKAIVVVRRRERAVPTAIWKAREGRELRQVKAEKKRSRRARRDRQTERRAERVEKAAKRMDAPQVSEEAVARQSIVIARTAALTQVNSKCLLL